MAARSVNLTVEQGTNFSTTFTVKNPDGTVLPLTGYSAVAKMAKHPSATTGISTFTVSVTSATGQVTLALSKEVTADLVPGRQYYDCYIESAGATRTRIVEGMILVTAGVAS